MTSPAPGWYSNPSAPGVRYWDGAQWTDQTMPVAPPSTPVAAPGIPTYQVMTAPQTPPGHPVNGLYQALTTPTSNRKATTGLTLALVSLLVNPFMVLSILAIVFGAQGRSEADAMERAGYGRVGGRAAGWAIGLGIAGCVVFVLIVWNAANNL
jgi:hypothetical protein